MIKLSLMVGAALALSMTVGVAGMAAIGPPAELRTGRPARARAGVEAAVPPRVGAMTPADAPEKAFTMAMAFFDEGSYPAAEGFFRQVPPGHPRYREAQRMLDQTAAALAQWHLTRAKVLQDRADETPTGSTSGPR